MIKHAGVIAVSKSGIDSIGFGSGSNPKFDCEITFEGANAVQDFPERLVAVIKLKPGRPRDKAEIESMFNAGRGRFYLQPDDVADINKTSDVSAYGNKDRKVEKNSFINVFRKVSNG